MKKILFLLLALPTMLVAQRKVAVYITAPESFDPDVKEIVGSELVSGIVQNRDFKAVESTADFARDLQNTQDNQLICNYGERLGVDLVCVANITPFRDSYYIKARLLDVRTLAIVSSASEGSPLASIEDILHMTERLVGQLFYSAAPVEEEFSTIGIDDKRGNCCLVAIDNTGANTVATFKILDAKGIRWSIYPTTVIRDRATGNEYKLISANDISTGASESYGVGIHPFTLTFEKLPYSVTNIDIVEPKGWEWDDITLKNYGKTGFHQFEDNSERRFGHLMHEQKLMREQEARLGQIVNVTNSFRSYLITITNERYSDFLIELNGKRLGTVPKRSQLTFRVAPEEYGLLKAIEVSSFLPTVMKFDVPPTKPTEVVHFTILRP